MKRYRTLEDFNPAQKSRFDLMHEALQEYNAQLRRGESAVAPAFTDDEMAEYSIYRQLVLAKECDEE